VWEPVIAYRCGSVPEVVEDGVTGFIVDGEEQAIEP
jgi:glycosyltransferase involved in cell wall biosynthesis